MFTVMDVYEVVSRVKTWVSGNSHGLVVSSVEEDERRINLEAPAGSFFITVPDGQEEWGVWSNEDNCVRVLSGSMDQLSLSSSTPLEEILERVCILLEAGGTYQMEDVDNDSEEEEEEDGFDGYYYGDDDDVDREAISDKSDGEVETAKEFFTGQGSPAAVHRLISDLKALNRSSTKYGIDGHPINDDLFRWEVELSDFPENSLLARDLAYYALSTKRKPVISMEMTFPKDYPMNPPFVRILRPRFKFLTGHVTIGGSICMQMLTRSGWSPSNDIETILIQIRAEILSDPKARLELSGGDVDYSEHEAKTAFQRMVMKYGWTNN